ncbi:MAG: PD-(D/E)XK nuclease family protein [Candidatus Neomarinimicrobiota bacterium]
MNPYSFSYSRLQTFKQCPAQYRFHYLDRLEATGRSIESFLGTCQHQALEWLYNQRLDERTVLFDDLLKRFRAIWSTEWDGSIFIARTGWDTDDYYQLGLRSLAGYYRQYAPFNEPVFGIEMKIKFDLDSDGQYQMQAILDRVDYHGEGHWSIHDYKTGRRILTPAQANRDLQMKVYFRALSVNQDEVTGVDVIWHFMRHGLEVRLNRVGWNQKRIAGMLKKRIDHIRTQENRPELLEPRESALCNWCYYWEYCQAKKGQPHPARLAQ